MTSNLEKSDGLVHCSVKMLMFCAKTIVKESREFELARLKKMKEKEKKKKEKKKKKKKKKERKENILAVW